jgi:tetratricopeptide (TPR) repeat protein
MKYLLYFFLFTISFQSISQTKKPNNLLILENQLFKLYNQELYDSAYKKIDQVIKDVNSTNLELCFTHIYLSQLNKRLFSYKKTFEELQIALEYAEKCKDVDFAKTNVLAEMALYYYDKDLIKESEELVLKLLPSAQQYLDETTHAYLLLIVGSIQFIDNNETESALNFFNKAEAILRKFNPCHLPLVYTKKLRLYTNTERAAEYEAIQASQCSLRLLIPAPST